MRFWNQQAVVAEWTFAMKTEANSGFFDVERIEQFSTLALILGVLAIFQWGIASLYWIGLLLIGLGTIGTLYSQVMRKNYLARIIERMTVVGMMVGILGMLQPWQIWLYENGFYILALSTLGFIIVSHIGSPDE